MEMIAIGDHRGTGGRKCYRGRLRFRRHLVCLLNKEKGPVSFIQKLPRPLTCSQLFGGKSSNKCRHLCTGEQAKGWADSPFWTVPFTLFLFIPPKKPKENHPGGQVCFYLQLRAIQALRSQSDTGNGRMKSDSIRSTAFKIRESKYLSGEAVTDPLWN